jgi:UDPglucose 6-dehydrogenase
MNVCVIGTGYVGVVTGACFAEFGVQTTCLDVDERKIEMLAGGEVPFFEPGLTEMVRRGIESERLTFTTSYPDAVGGALAVFIAVNTPPQPDGTADLTFVEQAAKGIAENLNDYKVVVTKSTVPAGTGALVRRIIEQHRPDKDVPFSVASNPEFLREGSAVADSMHPDRVVIGTEDNQAAAILKDLYRPLYLIETPFILTDVATAELIKYASNAFLAMKISYINEIAILAEKIGAEVHTVAKAMGLDGRISRKFLHPGLGYGGSCFPKDTTALASIFRQNDLKSHLVEATVEVNHRQGVYMLDKVRRMVGGDLKGKTVAQLGLSFKPNTSDTRESPALLLAQRMLDEGAKVQAFDPEAMDEARAVAGGLTFCKDPYEACQGAEILVLATEWNEFRMLNLDRVKDAMARPVMADLRNVYQPGELVRRGFTYEGVGRRVPAGVDA